MADSRADGADLHGRELFPRIERRAEGHGADHADPDRHGADGVCAEPRGEPRGGAELHRRVRAGGADSGPACESGHGARSRRARRGDEVHPDQGIAAGHAAGNEPTGERIEPRSGGIQDVPVGSGAESSQRSQRYVFDGRGAAADGKDAQSGVHKRGKRGAQELPGQAGQEHEVHSRLGEGGRGAGAWVWARWWGGRGSW